MTSMGYRLHFLNRKIKQPVSIYIIRNIPVSIQCYSYYRFLKPVFILEVKLSAYDKAVTTRGI